MRILPVTGLSSDRRSLGVGAHSSSSWRGGRIFQLAAVLLFAVGDVAAQNVADRDTFRNSDILVNRTTFAENAGTPRVLEH